jgi:small conductance mechanosensitive channel
MINNWVKLIEAKLNHWGVTIIKMLPNALMAIGAMIIFVIIARFLRKVFHNMLMKVSKSESISSLTSSVLYFIILVIGFLTALNILHLEKTVTSLLAGVGIIGLALGFAFQDLTSNFISGAFIVFKRPFDLGHTIESNGFLGKVEDIQLRATTIRTFAGLHVIIPNKDVFQKPIINYSLTERRRVEIEFPITNNLGATQLEELVTRAIAKNKTGHDVEEPEVYFTAMEEGKIKLYVSFWTKEIEPNDFIKVKHFAILNISNILKENKAYG